MSQMIWEEESDTNNVIFLWKFCVDRLAVDSSANMDSQLTSTSDGKVGLMCKT